MAQSLNVMKKGKRKKKESRRGRERGNTEGLQYKGKQNRGGRVPRKRRDGE